jgi:hypothetical protein
VTFPQFIGLFTWRQGEHVAFIGPSGSGKTTVALDVLSLQPYVAIIATKPADATLSKFAKQHRYKIMRHWPGVWDGVLGDPERTPRRVIWPKGTTLDKAQVSRQGTVIHKALAAAYREGGWCLYVDELWVLVNMLGLDFDAKMMLLQARSLGISFTVSTQRPAWVPLEVYDQSSHLFFWRDNDERNLSRLSGISWRAANEVRTLIANLEVHQFLYVHTKSGAMLRSTWTPQKG